MVRWCRLDRHVLLFHAGDTMWIYLIYLCLPHMRNRTRLLQRIRWRMRAYIPEQIQAISFMTHAVVFIVLLPKYFAYIQCWTRWCYFFLINSIKASNLVFRFSIFSSNLVFNLFSTPPTSFFTALSLPSHVSRFAIALSSFISQICK